MATAISMPSDRISRNGGLAIVNSDGSLSLKLAANKSVSFLDTNGNTLSSINYAGQYVGDILSSTITTALISNGSTGIKVGNTSTDKIGFWGNSAVVQPTGNILAALANTGLVANPSLAAGDVATALGYVPTSSASATTSGTYLASGGQVAWISGLTYRISAADYYIAGTHYTSTEQTVTLDAADVTNPRIDIIALDSISTVVKITGTASANAFEPDVDPTTQLKLTSVYLTANATTPPVTTISIYAENVEWTTSASAGTINLASTSNPHGGTKDIEGTNVVTGTYFQLQAPTTQDLSTQNQLVLYLRSKASFGGSVIRVRWLDSNGVAQGVPVSIGQGFWGFDSTNTTAYQQIVIPINQFQVPGGTLVNRIRFTAVGNTHIGFYADDIALQSGLSSTSAGGTPTQIVNDGGSVVVAPDGSISATPASGKNLTLTRGRLGVGVAPTVSTVQVDGGTTTTGVLILEHGSTLTASGLVGGFPSLLVLNSKDSNSFYGLGYINEAGSKIANYIDELDGNCLAFYHYSLSDNLTASNSLLTFGGFACGGTTGSSIFSTSLYQRVPTSSGVTAIGVITDFSTPASNPTPWLSFNHSSGSITLNGNATLIGEAANILAQRTGTANQKSSIYQTYTDPSNYVRFNIDWTADADNVRLGVAWAGTGSAKDIILGRSSPWAANGVAGQRITISYNGQTDLFAYNVSDGVTARYTALASAVAVGSISNHDLQLWVNNAAAWKINTSTHLLPSTDNTSDLGSSANRVRNAYFAGTVYGGHVPIGIYDEVTDASNTSTTETTLYSDGIGAARLAANKDKVLAQYGGTFTGAASATQQLRVYFGPNGTNADTLIFDSGALSIATGSPSWDLYVTVIRESSSVVRVTCSLTTSSAALAGDAQYTRITSLTLTANQFITLTGTSGGIGGGSSQVSAAQGYAQFAPAA